MHKRPFGSVTFDRWNFFFRFGKDVKKIVRNEFEWQLFENHLLFPMCKSTPFQKVRVFMFHWKPLK